MVSNERSISISVWNDVSFVNEKQFREGMGLGHANNRKITLLLTQHLFTSPRIVTRGEEIFLKIEIEN